MLIKYGVIVLPASYASLLLISFMRSSVNRKIWYSRSGYGDN